MSKKNKPVSIYKDSNNVMDTFRRNTLTKVIKYRVDGEVYAETIDLDIANGTFGRTLGRESKTNWKYFHRHRNSLYTSYKSRRIGQNTVR